MSHLRAWLHHGQEWGLLPYAIQGQARTLKTFFRFAQDEGCLEVNIGNRLKVPRTPKKIIQTFPEEQLRQLLASARLTRDKLISGLFIDTGIRVTELASLAEHLPQGQWCEREGGLFVRVTLPEGTDMEAFRREAKREGLSLTRGENFFPQGGGRGSCGCLARH